MIVMSTTFMVFDWIASQISSGPERCQFADFLRERKNPEMLHNRLTLLAGAKKAHFTLCE